TCLAACRPYGPTASTCRRSYGRTWTDRKDGRSHWPSSPRGSFGDALSILLPKGHRMRDETGTRARGRASGPARVLALRLWRTRGGLLLLPLMGLAVPGGAVAQTANAPKSAAVSPAPSGPLRWTAATPDVMVDLAFERARRGG